MKIKV